MKKRYLSPATNIVQMYELHYPILGSEVKFRMKIDDLEETYYEVDGETEKNADYLIKF